MANAHTGATDHDAHSAVIESQVTPGRKEVRTNSIILKKKEKHPISQALLLVFHRFLVPLG
jgi:hypothetical protein